MIFGGVWSLRLWWNLQGASECILILVVGLDCLIFVVSFGLLLLRILDFFILLGSSKEGVVEVLLMLVILVVHVGVVVAVELMTVQLIFVTELPAILMTMLPILVALLLVAVSMMVFLLLVVISMLVALMLVVVFILVVV